MVDFKQVFAVIYNRPSSEIRLSRLTRTANSAMIVSLLSHLLCCGLPILVNVLALVAGVGALSATFPWVYGLHDSLHKYELALLLFSGAALLFGFVAHRVSMQQNCVQESCSHEPCAPKKRQSRMILIVASVLFSVNLANYLWHYLR